MLNKLAEESVQHKILILFLIILVALSSIGLNRVLKNYDLTNQILVDQAQKRELVQARSGSQIIELFLKNLQIQLDAINKIEAVASLNEVKTRELFDKYIKSYQNTPVTSLIRIDQEGKSVIIANRQGNRLGEGLDFSDRDYFTWGKDPAHINQVFVSSPFISRAGATKGKIIIVLSTPSYFNGKFTGVTGMIVNAQEFTNFYINPLKTYQGDEAVLLDRSGKIVAGDDMVNQDIYAYAQSVKWPGQDDFFKKLEQAWKEEEGTTTLQFQLPGKKIQEFVVSYHKVKVDNKQWLLIIGNDKKLVESTLSPLLINSNVTLMTVTLGTVILGFLFVLVYHLSHQRGYKKGLKDGSRSS